MKMLQNASRVSKGSFRSILGAQAESTFVNPCQLGWVKMSWKWNFDVPATFSHDTNL